MSAKTMIRLIKITQVVSIFPLAHIPNNTNSQLTEPFYSPLSICFMLQVLVDFWVLIKFRDYGNFSYVWKVALRKKDGV
eukprot:UN23376